jgi:hypothetical protein
MQVRNIEDKLNIESQPFEIEELKCEEHNLIDDYNFSRNMLRDVMETNRNLMKIVANELQQMPSNVRVAEVAARMIESLTLSTEKLMGISQTFANIYKITKDKDDPTLKNPIIQNAIIVGSLSDVLKLKQIENKELNEIKQ